MFNTFIKKIVREKRKGKLIIGVCSTHECAGATHFCLLLATYFSEWLGLKTVYVDFNGKTGISYLQDFFLRGKEEKSSNFTVGRIDFYSSENLYRISEIIGEGTDCIILDIGHAFLDNRNEFLRCDIKVVLSSLAVWKQDKLRHFIEKVKDSFEITDWRYVIPFADEKAIKEGIRNYRINLYQMPYQPDPFTINTATIRFFDRILQK